MIRDPVTSFASPRRLLLHGLIAVLFVSCAGSARSDAAGRRRVLQTLAADSVLNGVPVDVKVEKGIAYLSGEIGTKEEETHALDAVSRTPGIIGVVNRLTFSAPRIVERIKETLAADPLVAQVPVTITANAGEVTLRSNQTDAQQRQRMVQLAAGVDGVIH